MKEAILYKKLEEGKVQCLACAHKCIISEGERGICHVKINKNGKLYSLNYGKIASISVDPIEKKPLFHFLPGSRTLSFASAGCNFQCKNCQNWLLSQSPRLYKAIIGQDIPPEEIVNLAKNESIPSISYTYTEPTVFLEYALDVMKLAKKENIKNIWVSNGFFSEETFNLISPYLDAANIDLKSFSEKFYLKYTKGRLEPVLETLKRLKKNNIWLEVTTLIIPGINDSPTELGEIAEFISKKLGKETPWHISRFSGEISWQMKNIPDTPIKTLESAWQIGKKAGVKYVYIGNIPDTSRQNTYCPKCGYLAIKRNIYQTERKDNNGKCSACGESLDIIDK